MSREGRLAVALAGLSMLMLTGLGFRFYHLQIDRHESYRSLKLGQSLSRIRLEDKRGIIVDCGGAVLATSIEAPSVFIDPRDADPRELNRLAALLGEDPAALAGRLAPKNRQFLWLKRKVPPELAEELKKFKGVGILTEYRRHYPGGRSAAHLLGFVDIDDRGLEGIEKVADSWLAPDARSLDTLMDAARRVVARRSEDPGPRRRRGDLVVTLHAGLQKIVEQELAAAAAQYRPNSALALAMNPRTGAVLAMAVLPDFDPSRPADSPVDARRNRILTDPYEPGSVVKPIVISRALEKGLVSPSTVFDCENGAFRYQSRVLHDHHPYGRLTVTEIVAKSSNIGAVKIGLKLGVEGVWEALDSFGFGHAGGIELPGESAGRLAPARRWTAYTLTSTPIGHEMMATPLQILRAYCAIANGGRLVTPHVLSEIVDEGYVVHRPPPRAARRVLSATIAAVMKEMLKETVAAGTATAAQVEGMSVAGKTGTTQMLDPQTGKYRHDWHIASYVGFAPVEDPKIALIVVLERPQGESYGGRVAAPVAGRVLARARAIIGTEEDAARARREFFLQGGGY